MAREIRISDAEWDVMEEIWSRGSVLAADVIAALSSKRDWNQSTIRTMLARLVEKGALKFEVDGSRYIYRPAVARKRCVHEQSRSFLDRVFGGDVGSLLLHYVRESKVRPEDIEDLRRLLDEKLSKSEED